MIDNIIQSVIHSLAGATCNRLLNIKQQIATAIFLKLCSTLDSGVLVVVQCGSYKDSCCHGISLSASTQNSVLTVFLKLSDSLDSAHLFFGSVCA